MIECEELIVRVKIKQLNGIETTSASSIKSVNTIKGNSLNINATSASEIDLEAEYETITIDASSTGNVTIKGKTLKLETNASLSQVYSHQRVFNLIKTVDEKFKHIFEIEKSERTQKLFQLNVSQVAYQFGLDYPELLGFSKDLLNQNKYKKLKVNYPWRFRLIATLIGFESVIRIKKQIRSKSN